MFEIKLDNPRKTYVAGGAISGQVIAHVRRLIDFGGIKLKFKGKAEVSWIEYTPRYVHQYAAQEKYIQRHIYILGRSYGKVKLSPGVYAFPFTYVLPTNIPSSFNHENGKIEYSITAKVDRTDEEFPKAKIHFKVEHLLDLSRYQSRWIIDEVHEKYYYCLPCCNEGEINVQIRIPSQNYAVGEIIRVLFITDLSSDDVEVLHVLVHLKQILTFRGKAGIYRKTLRKKEIIRSAQYNRSFARNEIKELSMSVPHVPHSGLLHCSIIDVKYRIYVKLVTSGLHHNTKKKYDILIGSKSVAAVSECSSGPPYPFEQIIESPPTIIIPNSPTLDCLQIPSSFETEETILESHDNISELPSTSGGQLTMNDTVLNFIRPPRTLTSEERPPDTPPPSYESAISRKTSK